MSRAASAPALAATQGGPSTIKDVLAFGFIAALALAILLWRGQFDHPVPTWWFFSDATWRHTRHGALFQASAMLVLIVLLIVHAGRVPVIVALAGW